MLAEIARDSRFKPTELCVEVDAGVVTLIGTNKLTVEIAPYAARDDTRIARAVRTALEGTKSPTHREGECPTALDDDVMRCLELSQMPSDSAKANMLSFERIPE